MVSPDSVIAFDMLARFPWAMKVSLIPNCSNRGSSWLPSDRADPSVHKTINWVLLEKVELTKALQQKERSREGKGRCTKGLDSSGTFENKIRHSSFFQEGS